MLKDRTREQSVTHPYRCKIDLGSHATDLALVREDIPRLVWAGEVEHRGEDVKRKRAKRRSLRRARRSRKTRDRKPRFQNRRRSEGWLPPALESRVANVRTWVGRLRRVVPVAALSMELVRFDTQKLQHPEIHGVEYQHGEPFGYEVKEYLLEKWGRRCAYCGREGVPVELEHLVPRSRGGTNRVSNLTDVQPMRSIFPESRLTKQIACALVWGTGLSLCVNTLSLAQTTLPPANPQIPATQSLQSGLDVSASTAAAATIAFTAPTVTSIQGVASVRSSNRPGSLKSVGQGLPGMPGGPPIKGSLGYQDPASNYMRPPKIGPLLCDPLIDGFCD